MWTACGHPKSPWSLSCISAHPIMVRLYIMVMNGQLTSFSFHVIRPFHFWDKAISDSDLETSRSRSLVWPKGKVIQSSQYPINLHPFHFTSIRLTISEIQLFSNLILRHPRSRSSVRSNVKAICRSFRNMPLSNQCCFIATLNWWKSFLITLIDHLPNTCHVNSAQNITHKPSSTIYHTQRIDLTVPSLMECMVGDLSFA